MVMMSTLITTQALSVFKPLLPIYSSTFGCIGLTVFHGIPIIRLNQLKRQHSAMIFCRYV